MQKILLGLMKMVRLLRVVCIIGIVSVFVGLAWLQPALAGETIPQVQIHLEREMTLQEAAQANNTSLQLVSTALGIDTQNAGQHKLESLLGKQNISTVSERLRQLIIEKKLEDNKNWSVIFTKLALWALLIVGSGFLLAKKKVTPGLRLTILAGVVIVLGFILGSDPNPLGMIKDALYIYGTTGVIFKPRIIVAVVILLTVVIGGRLYCGWGCHLGALQEILYYTPFRKFRIPFAVTNLIRFLVFAVVIIAALVYGLDILGVIDPYQMFNFTSAIGVLITVGILTLLSLFTYRPWCTLMCPFGFLSWVVEKFSLMRIKRHPQVCKNCYACANICPTGRAASRLAGQTSGECYSCGKCIDACQYGALTYGANKKAPRHTRTRSRSRLFNN